MATIIDVANNANVSIATVSRYFKNPNVVSMSTQAKIKEAVKELNYTPNSMASMLKSNKTNTIGLFISDVKNTFFNKLIDNLNQALNARKKRLVVFYNDPKVPVVNQIRTLISLRIEALIFMPDHYSETIESLLTHNNCYPLQLFIDYFDTFDSLVVDDEQGGFIAASELIANGHSNILLIDFDNKVYINRNKGFIKALKQHNLPYNKDMTLALADNDYDKAYDTIAARIANTKPTAIISVTNSLTQNVEYILKQQGIQVGRDISLIMYDESQWARLEQLTTISHPFDEIVENIQQMLDDCSADNIGCQTKKIVVTPLLTRRCSVIKLN